MQRDAKEVLNVAYELLEQTNDMSQVLEYLSPLYETFQMDPKFVSRLGYFLYEAGWFEEAKEILEKSIAVPKLMTATSLLILANIYANVKSVGLIEIAIDKMSQKLS